jgi:hypothetical protein
MLISTQHIDVLRLGCRLKQGCSSSPRVPKSTFSPLSFFCGYVRDGHRCTSSLIESYSYARYAIFLSTAFLDSVYAYLCRALISSCSWRMRATRSQICQRIVRMPISSSQRRTGIALKKSATSLGCVDGEQLGFFCN